MISTIEKELMVVGFMSFLFTIILNSAAFIPSNWESALELAGY
jgi:hypothetical protein